MKPVRWVEVIQFLEQQGVNTIVECGPGKVLAGLIKRIAPSVAVHSINDQASLDSTLSALAQVR
jgi:[acyl-carrier-protein] S-malonyltransferase